MHASRPEMAKRSTRSTLAAEIVGAFARGLALFAMLVQFTFYADHIGAVAAKSASSAGIDARLGVFELCTGNGIKLVNADGTPVDEGADCPICENASVMAFGEPTALPAPVFAFVSFAVAWSLPRGTHATEARFAGAQPIRGPPSVA